jgi:glyoxylase-like metal-dependent hydrolase (beta-lactamase superfamily II)
VLWKLAHPDHRPDQPLHHGQTLDVGGHRIEVMHTPGHAPGAVCFYLPEAGVVFSGDTLFHGGPGATGRSYSDFPTIVESIRDRLLNLPEDTVVHTGHGDDTRIGAEAPSIASGEPGLGAPRGPSRRRTSAEDHRASPVEKDPGLGVPRDGP